MTHTPRAYEIELPGLAERVAQAHPSDKHKSLVGALRGHRSEVDLGEARVTAVKAGFSLRRRKVLDAAGELVHDNHEAWLKEECDRDGGDVVATWHRLRPLDYLLSRCEFTKRFIAVQRGNGADDFLQLEVRLEDEATERRLFDVRGAYHPPEDLQDLCSLAENGGRLADDAKRRLRPPTYCLDRIVDVPRLLTEAEGVYAQNNVRAGAQRVVVTSDDGETRYGTVAELCPESAPHPTWGGRRLFNDWTLSSAGRSGARLCDHWALSLSDWTDPKAGDRHMNLVPIWAFAGKLAKVDPPSLSDYALYAKLETLDRRVGVKFGWFFFMLHGNRVDDWVGERVIRAAESGTIVLAEHDYRVLKAWQAHPYGF